MSGFRRLVRCAVLFSLCCSYQKKQAAPESRAEDEQAIRNIEIAASEAIATNVATKLIRNENSSI